MEQFFTSLSRRQQMLLLTSMAFGGSEAVNAYEFLEPSEEELLRHRAQGLSQIPRDRRVPALIQEIKKLVTWRRRQLASADPKRLAALLKDERPTLVEVVLNAVPGELAVAVREELGNPPPVKLLRDVKPGVLAIVRWKLEASLRAGAQVGSFRFSDVLILQARELLAVADRMGARVLATAIAGLGDGAQEFLGKLPPDQRTLAAKAAEAGAARRLTPKDAQLVLELHGALEDPSRGLRSAGVQRIIRAGYAQAPEFAVALAGRHQGDLGALLQRWLKDEKGRPVKGDGGRMDIVEQMERLAQKGVVDRPMRLPPPARPSLPPPPPRAPERGASNSGEKPPPRQSLPGLSALPVRRSSVQSTPQGRAPPEARPVQRPLREAPRSRPPLGDKPTDSARQRVLRDGKPLVRLPGAPRSTSPVAPIPKRRQGYEKSADAVTDPRSKPVIRGPRRK